MSRNLLQSDNTMSSPVKVSRVKGDKKFHTLPLPRRNKEKKKTPSKDDSDSVVRKKSFVDMTKRKLSRGVKDQGVSEPLQRKVGIEKDMDKLQGSEKSVMFALKWFLEVIHKDTLILLAGSTTKILQEVMELNQCLNQCLNNEQSSILMSCHNQVYQSLANLIHWADNIVLFGNEAVMDKDEGSEVTEAVRSGIEELVRLYLEKLKDRQNKLATDIEDQPQSPKPNFEKKEDVYDQRPLSPREQKILDESPIDSWSLASRTSGSECGDIPPPKPPLPSQRILVTEVDSNSEAPPLPPKRHSRAGRRRSSLYDNASDDGTYPVGSLVNCLESGSSVSVTSQQSNLSNGSSYSRPESLLSSQLSSPSIHGLEWESPDMSRLSLQHSRRSSTSSSEQRDFERSSNSGSDSTPPCLPVKQRPRLERHLSAYDNVDPAEAQELSNRCQNLQEAVFSASVAQDEVLDHRDACQSGYDYTSHYDEEPPPLPPKQMRHINTYLDLVHGYSEDQFEMTYYEHISHSETHYPAPDGQYIQSREQLLLDSYYGSSNGIMNGRRPVSGASYAEIDDRSESSAEGSLGAEPPALPVKRRSSSSTSPPLRTRHYTNPERVTAPLYNVKKKSESMIESRNEPNIGDIDRLMDSGRKASIEAKEKAEDGNEEDLGTLGQLNAYNQLIVDSEDASTQIKGGPVDALIVYAADADRKDLVYYEAFLTTYRMFIASNDLLDKLLRRYKKFRHKTDMKSKRANRNAFLLLLRVAGDLIGQVEDDILKKLMELVFQLLCDGELMLAKILRDKVLAKIEDNKLALQRSNRLPLSGLGVSVVKANLLDFSSLELAEQMTILDSELFQKIEIPEVLLWAKEQSEALSPNLTIFTEHFNKMSYWARSLILQENRAQDREKLLTKFIKVMKHLRKLNNFNSYLAILSALDSAPIRRLEWQKQTVEGLKEYCQLIDSSASFRTYRAALAEAEPPCIPYLGLILQDITFVHIGNPDKLPDSSHINFTKCWQFFNILDSMRRFKQHHYVDLRKSPKVLAFFNDFIDFLDEEAMWQLSKTIKPQGSGRPKPPPT